MPKNLFSIPIFFIVFRETIEAAIIVSVLLGLAEQIVHNDPEQPSPSSADNDTDNALSPADDEIQRRRLIRRLRFQIFAGAGSGLLVALAIGAAFIAVWFTKASNLWSKSEELWEAIFMLVASVMIFGMGITMLKMDRAKAKWRVKLQRSFEGKEVDRKAVTGKWILFMLPFVTVLREGMEAVVFVGGVSLGQPATSIPIAAIVGLICGVAIGFGIYEFASRTTLSMFLVFMTNFLLLIGSGLFSRSVGIFESHAFSRLLGADVDDAGGTGPGSYPVKGNVWHLDCCSPEGKFAGQGWTIFSAILGWTNNATLGSVLAYVFYWLAVIVVLVYWKYTEGRTTLLGRESAAAIRRKNLRQEKLEERLDEDTKGALTPEKEVLPR